jgi:hypothetical protein
LALTFNLSLDHLDQGEHEEKQIQRVLAHFEKLGSAITVNDLENLRQRSTIGMGTGQLRTLFPLIALPIIIPLLVTYVERLYKPCAMVAWWDLLYLVGALLYGGLCAFTFFSETERAHCDVIIGHAVAEYTRLHPFVRQPAQDQDSKTMQRMLALWEQWRKETQHKNALQNAAETREDARVLLESAVNMYIYEGTMTWSRFNAMMVLHAFIFAGVIQLFVDDGHDATHRAIIGLLAIVGIVVCVIWLTLLERGFAHQDEFYERAKAIEEHNLNIQMLAKKLVSLKGFARIGNVRVRTSTKIVVLAVFVAYLGILWIVFSVMQ